MWYNRQNRNKKSRKKWCCCLHENFNISSVENSRLFGRCQNNRESWTMEWDHCLLYENIDARSNRARPKYAEIPACVLETHHTREKWRISTKLCFFCIHISSVLAWFASIFARFNLISVLSYNRQGSHLLFCKARNTITIVCCWHEWRSRVEESSHPDLSLYRIIIRTSRGYLEVWKVLQRNVFIRCIAVKQRITCENSVQNIFAEEILYVVNMVH